MTTVITLAYLVAAVCFILGLKQLSSPKGARNGNFTAAAGMVIALLATINVVGGFVVTDRMLEMFKGRQTAKAPTPTATPKPK